SAQESWDRARKLTAFTIHFTGVAAQAAANEENQPVNSPERAARKMPDDCPHFCQSVIAPPLFASRDVLDSPGAVMAHIPTRSLTRPPRSPVDVGEDDIDEVDVGEGVTVPVSVPEVWVVADGVGVTAGDTQPDAVSPARGVPVAGPQPAVATSTAATTSVWHFTIDRPLLASAPDPSRN
ncbi:MAG: hypothetical protein QOG52_309, partial [Frankiaceae bacterium]|nr:hypothetical protein [Frankiaceae bacterium]